MGTCPSCGEAKRHHRLCPHWVVEDARAQAIVRHVDELREDRANGRRAVPSAIFAVRWFFRTRSAWGCARGLAVDPEHEGTGTPNRGADDPRRRLFAAIAWAIKKAEEDDASRHPSRRAPIAQWLAEHIVAGRAYAWIAESKGWTELEVSRRVERALRIIRDRLREGRWLEGRDA